MEWMWRWGCQQPVLPCFKSLSALRFLALELSHAVLSSSFSPFCLNRRRTHSARSVMQSDSSMLLWSSLLPQTEQGSVWVRSHDMCVYVWGCVWVLKSVWMRILLSYRLVHKVIVPTEKPIMVSLAIGKPANMFTHWLSLHCWNSCVQVHICLSTLKKKRIMFLSRLRWGLWLNVEELTWREHTNLHMDSN